MTHIHSKLSGTLIFNFVAGKLSFTKTETPPEHLSTLFRIRWNFWYFLKGSLSTVSSVSQVSVKTAISTMFNLNVSPASIVLSVSSLLPKLWIFDKSITGRSLLLPIIGLLVTLAKLLVALLVLVALGISLVVVSVRLLVSVVLVNLLWLVVLVSLLWLVALVTL